MLDFNCQETVCQGDVFDVDLDGAQGYETMNDSRRGCRPCVVVQADTSNRHSGMTIIVPLTSTVREKPYPTEVVIEPGDLKIADAQRSTVKCSQIRAVDKTRMKSRRGRISDPALQRVLETVSACMGLSTRPVMA